MATKDIPSTKPRIDKLGVKPGLAVAIIGDTADDTFEDELTVRLGAPPSHRLKANLDLIFFTARSPADLERLTALREKIRSNGVIWVLYPKGVRTITQDQVMRGIKAADLVDIKVVSFSTSLTGLKAVIPLASRRELN